MFDVSKTLVFIVVGPVLTFGCGNNHEHEGENESLSNTSSTMSEGGELSDTSMASSDSTSGTTSGNGTESGETDQDPTCPEVMTGRVEFKDAEMERFRCLREVHGTLVVTKTELKDFQVLSKLSRVTESLQILNNPHPQSLSGLENLVEVGGLMWVSNNPLLKDITQVSSIRVSGGLGILHNDRLTDLTSLVGNFPNPTGDIGRDLNIGHLIGTEHLTGLESITLFEGRIFIHRNPNLVDLQGLTNAMRGVRSRSDLHLVENPVLSSFAGLEDLTEMGTLTMERNPSLISMEGLGSLQRAEEIWVQESSEFRSVKGLESLEEMGSFIVGGCLADAFVGSPELKTLDGLQGLKHVDHLNLVATGLTMLAGLEGLESVG